MPDSPAMVPRSRHDAAPHRFSRRRPCPGPELAEVQLRLGDLPPPPKPPATTCVGHAEGTTLGAGAGTPGGRGVHGRRKAKRVVREADSLHHGSLDLYEEARTRLAFGACCAVTRAGWRRVAPRQALNSSSVSAPALGRIWQRPNWTRRVSGRGAAGKTSWPPSLAGDPHCAAARGGRTTKETAAVLFLSPKTVEYHLRHMYQKLDIRSRSELSAIMAAQPN